MTKPHFLPLVFLGVLLAPASVQAQSVPAQSVPAQSLQAQNVPAQSAGQTRDKLWPEPMPAEYREIAARADSYFTALSQTNRFNGVVLLHRGKWTLLKKGYGTDLDSNTPSTPSAKFRLGSLTEQFTAAGILQLEEQGKLRVEDTIGTYLTYYPKPAADQVTIHHLLTHTSGIPSVGREPQFAAIAAGRFTMRDVMAQFKDKPLEFAPGSRFQYSDSGYFILAAIIEKVTGWSYDHFVQLNLLERAGMSVSGRDNFHPVLAYRAFSRQDGASEPGPYHLMAESYAAGSLYSTLEDLFRWDQALYRKTLLDPQTIARMFKPWIAVSGDTSFGYGWTISNVQGHRNVSANGASGEFTSYISRFPDDNAMFVYLRNGAAPLPESVNRDIAGILFGDNIKPPEQVTRATQGPSLKWAIP
jgi:CubicO group peptidase (beta-lactamase class C family)